MRLAGYIIGSVTLGYLSAAFVFADINWLSGIWEWSAAERGGTLYLFGCCVLLGALGSLIIKPNR